MRSSIAVLATLCFALSAFTWGSMPGCVLPAGQPAAHAVHGHGARQDHAHQPDGLPGSTQCAVHLCCIQLGGAAAHNWTAERLSAPTGGNGPVSETLFVLLRPSHTLPLAHAPPGTLV